jgi:hypothetical protein
MASPTRPEPGRPRPPTTTRRRGALVPFEETEVLAPAEDFPSLADAPDEP